MVDAKVRRRKNARASTDEDDLTEPLLEAEDESSPSRTSTSGYEGHESSRSALVPYNINRIDWEALLQAFVDSCRAGWSGVLATIASCLGTFFPQQLQPVSLSHAQEQRLAALQERITQQYDPESPKDRQALLRLWDFAFPGVHPPGDLKDRRWTEMGWQRDDPASDFRGAGFISLENHLYMAEHQPELWQRLLHKTQGQRSQWEYPFAVAGINLTFMLEQLLDLRKQHTGAIGHTPSTAAGRAFLDLVAESEHDAFEKVYCLAFDLLDRVWLDMRASYMDFSQVLAKVRSRLDEALSSGGVKSLADLKAMLK